MSATALSEALMQAHVLPPEVAAEVDAIAEQAMECAFAHIHQRLRSLGYPCSGDVAPWELLPLEAAFKAMVRSVALNNDTIGALQG